MGIEYGHGLDVRPAFHVIAEYQKSVAQYPNIKIGEEFEGYKLR